MTKLSTAKLIKLGAAFAFGLAVVLLLVVTRIRLGGYGVPPRLQVPAPFKSLRESPGHVEHIADHKVKCSECHDLAEHGFEVPAEDLCKRCHTDRVSTIHVGSPLAASAVDCQSCHTFTLDRSIQPHNCVRCHEQPQGEAKAVVTHATARCVDCHNPHATPSLVPRTCESCHEDRTEVHHASKAPGAQLCLDCHGVHDDKTEADKRCRTCHTSDKALTKKAAIPRTATFKGHDKCVKCHEPHQFTAPGAKKCKSCHDDTPVLARGPKAHKACDTCHRTHDVSPDDAEARCERCHKKVKPTHPPDDKTGKCLGCHPVHGDSLLAGTFAMACESCHDEAATPTSFHVDKTKCTDCHTTHSTKLAATDSAKCGSCHKEQRALTAKVTKAGHAKCIDCHEQAAHKPKQTPKSCDSCHKVQSASLTKGHDKCGDCHVTHSGAMQKGVTCAKCHEDQAKGPHMKVKNKCESCHRPHGPKGVARPPKCDKCHEVARLPGLHHLKDHQSCDSCHSAHEPVVRAGRASCATAKCHPTVDGKPVSRHEPDAKLCSGCHVFKAGKAPTAAPK